MCCGRYYYYFINLAKAPFDGKAAKAALGSFMEEYACANNFFNCDLEFNVDPNVPGLITFLLQLLTLII